MPRPRKTLPIGKPVLAKTAVVYARVSTKEQAEEGWSVEAQLNLHRAYALTKGLKIVDEFVELESAKETGRPVFKRLVERVRQGDVTAIITEKVDRLYRNLRDPIVISELDVELHFVKESMVLTKTSRSADKFMHDIRLVVAKNYCDNLSEEAIKGLTEKARQGIWPTLAPIGYVNAADGHKRVIALDPDRAELVGQLFKLYATGQHSIKDLVKTAKQIGLRNRKGSALNHSHMHMLLQNPIYIGVVRWKGQDYEGKHPAIVSPGLFKKVQDIMTGRQTQAGFGSRDYLYRGLFRCGKCGCLMSPSRAKGKYVYYGCSGYKGCDRSGIREEIITDEICRNLKGLTIRPTVLELLKQALKDSLEDVRRSTGPQIEALTREHTRLRNRLDQIYADKLDGVLDAESYLRHRAKFSAELETIEKTLGAFTNADSRHYDDTISMLEMATNLFQTYELASNEEKREMLQYLLSNSEIEGGKVRLIFKSWFKLVLEANQYIAESGASDTDLEFWSG